MKVVISAPYMLRERHKVEPLLSGIPLEIVWADVQERLEEPELIHYLSGAHGIICGDDRFSETVYRQSKDLKVVVKWGTGIDSILKEEAEKYQVKVYRTPNAFTDPVADTALAYALAYCRNVVVNDGILKNGGWHKPQGYALSELTVGIIGLGAIGSAFAKRLQACGARVLAYDIVPKDQEYATMVDLPSLLRQSNIISMHCDLNTTSRHLLNSATFAQMHCCPFVINTGRGPLINESDLITALQTKQISGAGLDVFEHEPLALNSPLRSMNNVFLAAHNSNSSLVCWDRVHINSVNMLLEGLGIGRQ